MKLNDKDQILLESLYESMYKKIPAIQNEISKTELYELFQQDLKTIDELIEEGFFGDVLNKAKQGASALAGKAKGAISNLKQGVSQAIVKKLIDMVMSKLNDNDKANVFGMIAGGEVDKKSVQTLKQSVGNEAVKESIEGLFKNDKTFFVENFFTKEILQEAIVSTNFLPAYQQILTEAEAANPTQNRPLRQAMQYSNKLADEFAYNIANKLQELYGKNSKYGKNNEYIKKAIPKIMDGVNKRIDKQFKTNFGVSTINNTNAAGAPTDQAGQATAGQPGQASANAPEATAGQPGQAPTNAPGATADQTKKPGFIQRVLNFISNPKVYVTAGIAVAVIGFAAAVIGGAPIASMLSIYAYKMAYGTGAKLVTGAINRKLKGGKVLDPKAIATDAGKGMLLGAFSAGLGAIAAVVGHMLAGAGGAIPDAQHPVSSQQHSVPDQQHSVPDKGFQSSNYTPQDSNLKGIDAAKSQFEAVLRSQGIKGVKEWAGTASPAFTNAAGDMHLNKDQYAKLAHEIAKLSQQDTQQINDIKNLVRSGSGQGKAQQLASNLIKNWLKR